MTARKYETAVAIEASADTIRYAVAAEDAHRRAEQSRTELNRSAGNKRASRVGRPRPKASGINPDRRLAEWRGGPPTAAYGRPGQIGPGLAWRPDCCCCVRS